MSDKEHIEPISLKAGDTRLLINGQPPLVDCRVVAEAEYQILMNKIKKREAYARQKCEEQKEAMITKMRKLMIEEGSIFDLAMCRVPNVCGENLTD